MRFERFIECESENEPAAENIPYVFVVPYCTCESALLFVCQMTCAVEVPIDAVSVLEIVRAGARGVEEAPVVVSVVVACPELACPEPVEGVEVAVLVPLVEEVVVAACDELPVVGEVEPVESVEVEVAAGEVCSGS